MKKNFIAFFKGFSLIELLISLIIISCIVAAFAPVMTKRLQSGGITLGGEKITADCSAKFSSDCKLCQRSSCLICDKNSASCPGGYVDVATCSCKSCVSGGNCKTCTNATSCASCPTDRVLSGGKCVACDANKYAPDGNTFTSCLPCNANCSACSASADNCSSCLTGRGKSGTSCVVCEKGYFSEGGNNTCKSCSTLGALRYQDLTGQSGCKTCSGPNAQVDSGRTQCITFTCPTGCTACSSATVCTACSDTYYKSGSICKPCTDFNGESTCTRCTSSGCSECGTGYQANASGKCEKIAVCPNWAIKVTLSSKDYCFTKENIGDNTTVNNLIGFSASGGTSGFSFGSGRCWKHSNTATSVGMPSPNPGFNYSGQGRTVCNWNAANYACTALKNATSKNWGLPSQTIMNALKSKINSESNSCSSTPTGGSIQKCAGANGLQLCDYTSSSAGSPRCYGSNSCSGSPNGTCYPGRVWSAEYGSSTAYAYGLGSGSFSGPSSYGKTRAFSVRCVLGPL